MCLGIVSRCRAVRARFCTNYVAMLANAGFAAKSAADRAEEAEADFFMGTGGGKGYRKVLEAHFLRDHGDSIARALYATVRGYQFTETQLNDLVADGVCFIQSPEGGNPLTLIDEVRA